ncbi:MAG: MFS transporter [Pseudonocardia sp.]|uniref:MFS transporter n=1 Tax=unclassified Pseudonocardia TaxID=2619320 RepID=UPI00086E36B0|nr:MULTISPECIES: MFS transporter [unclassified Pseudonocardia]MBN9112337.1 MFS transporter [Pseudonocardia sp.]ODU24251.1 MAG: MFS transporter [Pseudonocardia sp. SCN 72-51]ODV08998.1 MAG: MFS transporter [Pseudonocardia sp. SCN 73-27]
MAIATLPTGTPAAPSAPVPHRIDRRVALAGLTGTMIEFYDYFIYGTAAALVFNKVFFPHLSPTMGAVAALATLAVVFVFRPLGSIVFGHVGDRLGRKRTLVITLTLMGVCTVGVGLMPGAATIGWVAPVLLVLFRAAQGFAVGGEWAGAALFTSENAADGRRGRLTMYPQLGACVAFALASLTFLIVNLSIGETSDAFIAWGWRIPFLLSAVLIAVGLYVRLHTGETPVFTDAQRNGDTTKAPFLDVWRRQTRTMLLVIGVTTGIFGAMTVGSVYLTTYATTTLHMSMTTILLIDALAALAACVTTVFASVMSDRIGRRRIVLAGSVGLAVWSLVLFPLMNVGTPLAVGTAAVVLLALIGVAYGPLAAYLPELFATRYRYSGAGVSYNLGGVAGGAVVLLIAAPLSAVWGGVGLGIYLAVMLVAGIGCLLALPETRDRSLV